MVAYKIAIEKSKLAYVRWFESYFEEIDIVFSYGVWAILLLDKINSSYYKAKHLRGLFCMVSNEQWWIIFGNFKINQYQSFLRQNLKFCLPSIIKSGKLNGSDKLSFVTGCYLNDWILVVILLSDITAAAVRLV